ncbi:GDSL-type esterase/lipase family protein, partial [Hydrotalea sp.]|uniref:GDSL-type esterase/lipase family protein n=1 Tax=Hydrotalea sp. TaxID=2881279 RepID=UPI00258BBB8F
MKRLLAIMLMLIIIAFKMQDEIPTIYLVGDSTMANKPLNDNPEKGWGMYLAQFFNHTVKIENRAVNGRSTKSFIDEGKWDAVVQQLKPGDYVFIQFGHNDEKKDDPKRFADAHGLYKNNLIHFVKDAIAKNAIPVLITPVARRRFDAMGRVDDRMHGDYPAVVKEVADSMHISFIDLFTASKTLLQQLGPEASKKLYLWIPPHHFDAYSDGRKDDTHFSEYGAKYMASLVCEGIRQTNLPVAAALLKTDFNNKFAYQLPIVYTPHFAKDTFNIIKYGAVSDGVTLNTQAIQAAINACFNNGGGVVAVPDGFWVTGPIELKNNVNLYVSRGALLQFTKDFTQYKLVESNWEGQPAARNQSPISAQHAENIAITGSGIIDGNGDAWRMVKRDKLTNSQWQKLVNSGGILSEDKKTWYPTAETFKGAHTKDPGVLKNGKKLSDFDSIKTFLRPNLLVLQQCKNVLLEGVTFQNSPAWCLHPLMCDQLTVRNIYAKNPWYA